MFRLCKFNFKLTIIKAILERTTKQDQELAQSSILQIRQAASEVSHSGFAKIKIQEQEQFLRIPKKAFHLLVAILNNMAERKSIT